MVFLLLIPRYFLPFSFSFDFPPFLFFFQVLEWVFLFIFVFNYCQCSWLQYISTCVCCLSKKIMIFVHELCLGFYWTHVCVWLPQHCTFKGLNLGQVCVKPFFLLFFIMFVMNFHSLFFTKFKESFFQFIYLFILLLLFVVHCLFFFHVGNSFMLKWHQEVLFTLIILIQHVKRTKKMMVILSSTHWITKDVVT